MVEIDLATAVFEKAKYNTITNAELVYGRASFEGVMRGIDDASTHMAKANLFVLRDGDMKPLSFITNASKTLETYLKEKVGDYSWSWYLKKSLYGRGIGINSIDDYRSKMGKLNRELEETQPGGINSFWYVPGGDRNGWMIMHPLNGVNYLNEIFGR